MMGGINHGVESGDEEVGVFPLIQVKPATVVLGGSGLYLWWLLREVEGSGIVASTLCFIDGHVQGVDKALCGSRCQGNSRVVALSAFKGVTEVFREFSNGACVFGLVPTTGFDYGEGCGCLCHGYSPLRKPIVGFPYVLSVFPIGAGVKPEGKEFAME
jgi:hypothetical protein